MIPVLTRDVCKSLGIRLKRSDAVPQFKAYLSVDPSKGGGPSILLPAAQGQPLGSHFERFCVAHELAHYFLMNEYDLLPKSDSEYWQHEELCDDFARHLLIPEHYIRKKIKQTSPALRSYLALCREISLAARVPWIQAAIRLTEINSHLVFLRCSHVSKKAHGDKHKSKNPLRGDETLDPLRSTFIVKSSSLPHQKGIGTVINGEMPLHPVLKTMLQQSYGRKKLIQRDITSELKFSMMPKLKSTLKKLVSANAVAFAETEGGKYPDIKIIIGAPLANSLEAA